MGKLLEAFKANRIVVGHTVQKGGRIRPRFGDKMPRLDTGMLSRYYPRGRASAMEICGGAKFTAQYYGRAGSASRIRRVFRLRTECPGNIERCPMGPLVQKS